MNFYIKIKFSIDIIVALILVFLLFPVFIICSILIKLEDPSGPVLFVQKRVGLNNKLFNVYKFRSMKVKNSINGKPLNDSQRMLKLGNIIRKLSLDELPQLFNIIKGEMSFIGPRPLPVLYLPYFNKFELTRHAVKPGISGWAQVNGRNNLNWDKKFKLDIEYVENMSLKLDIKILFLTIWKVLRKSDVVVRGENEVIDFHTYRINQKRDIDGL